MVPLVSDERSDAQTTLRDLMGTFKKKGTKRELSFEDESVEAEAVEEEDEAKDDESKKKQKPKSRSKKPRAQVAKTEGDILDPKKVTVDSQRRA